MWSWVNWIAYGVGLVLNAYSPASRLKEAPRKILLFFRGSLGSKLSCSLPNLLESNSVNSFLLSEFDPIEFIDYPKPISFGISKPFNFWVSTSSLGSKWAYRCYFLAIY